MPNLQAKAAEAELTTLRATLQRELLDQESTTAQVHSEYEQAKMERQTNDNLQKNGLDRRTRITRPRRSKRDELANRDADREQAARVLPATRSSRSSLRNRPRSIKRSSSRN